MSDLDNSVSEETTSEVQNVKNGTNAVDVVKDDNKSNDVQVIKNDPVFFQSYVNYKL